MIFNVLTLFPGMFRGPLDESILQRAKEKGLVEVHLYNIRDFTEDKHHIVDDYGYGGGPGMVMKPEPIFRAVESVREGVLQRRGKETAEILPVILLSPQGKLLEHRVAQGLAREEEVVLICGHYEGVDERVREYLATDEISIGDYVLTGGELAAMVLIDAVVRLIPGVLGDLEAARDDSFYHGLLQHPVYTRPAEFRGWNVPEVLLSGNHQEVERWRREESLRRTWLRRSDLLKKAPLTSSDRAFLERLEQERTSGGSLEKLDRP